MGCTQSSEDKDHYTDRTDCTQSSQATSAVAQSSQATPAVVSKAKPAPAAAPETSAGPPPRTVKRIDKTCAATFGGVSVRYAYLTQNGYYPEDPAKPNQDAYAVSQDFAGRDTDAFFSVFDGHGDEGDKCAQFARKKLSSLLSKATIAARDAQQPDAAGSETDPSEHQQGTAGSGAELSEDACREILSRVHTTVDAKLHKKADIDDSLSGTTAVSLYLHGGQNKITVSNVGDSRAVVGRAARADGKGKETEETLEAFALSQDQTPYRLDERVRLRRRGARIRTIDQISGVEPVDKDEAARDEERLREGGDGSGDGIKLGEEIDVAGDPPRVFAPDGDYPGCAFSRSIGDATAGALGVIPEPEIATWEVTPEDRVIVLASDGVFEFLTNQAVVDLCAEHADPLEACRAVAAESYRLWLQYEQRSDDITMICIFVDDVDVPQASNAFRSTAEKRERGLSTSETNSDITVHSGDSFCVKPLTVQKLAS